METFWVIIAITFVLGVFAPLVVCLLALPFVLLAAVWTLVRRPRSG